VKRHVFHPEANEEYAEAAEYYSNIAPRLGTRFHDEIERLILEVRRHPERFFRISPPVQRAKSPEFPYSVVYLDQPDQIWIVAVMHSKRRPGYWRHRISL
jgi:toxin ParE1/3/4